jgi:GH25 family lysozyme M1 (1,4-beta-N-acetylmuramidase)
MPDTRLADISEFQETIDARAYLSAGHSCLIVRAHNGHRPDNKWPGRRDYLRGYPFTALGWYQYLVSSRDAATQARELIKTVGPLRDNEFVILDHEEGAGNQTGRADAWFRQVDTHYGFKATLYAGLAYCRTNLGGWDRWAARPRWLAAYQTAEPRDPHDLWQHTDNARFPGLAGGVDGNLFHGTDREFLRKMRPGAPPPAAAAYVPLEGDTVAANHDGRLEAFNVQASTVEHRWQQQPNGAWAPGWHSLGAP